MQPMYSCRYASEHSIVEKKHDERKRKLRPYFLRCILTRTYLHKCNAFMNRAIASRTDPANQPASQPHSATHFVYSLFFQIHDRYNRANLFIDLFPNIYPIFVGKFICSLRKATVVSIPRKEIVSKKQNRKKKDKNDDDTRQVDMLCTLCSLLPTAKNKSKPRVNCEWLRNVGFFGIYYCHQNNKFSMNLLFFFCCFLFELIKKTMSSKKCQWNTFIQMRAQYLMAAS